MAALGYGDKFDKIFNFKLRQTKTRFGKPPQTFAQARYAQAKKKKIKMINLLQENIEKESQRTNSTFGFCRHTKAAKKNQKSYFLPTLNRNKIQNY